MGRGVRDDGIKYPHQNHPLVARSFGRFCSAFMIAAWQLIDEDIGFQLALASYPRPPYDAAYVETRASDTDRTATWRVQVTGGHGDGIRRGATASRSSVCVIADVCAPTTSCSRKSGFLPGSADPRPGRQSLMGRLVAHWVAERLSAEAHLPSLPATSTRQPQRAGSALSVEKHA